MSRGSCGLVLIFAALSTITQRIEYQYTTHRVPKHHHVHMGYRPGKFLIKLSLSLLCTPTHTPNTQFLSHVDTLNPYFFFGSAVGLKEEVVLGQP